VRVIQLSFWNSGGVGTAETSSVFIRLNGNVGGETLAATVTNNLPNTAILNNTLSIPVLAGDYFEIRWATPTWATRPRNVRLAVTVFVE
jgi:hypothetical protein